MCYTIKIDLAREELERRFGASFAGSDKYKPGTKINGFSLPHIPVICQDKPDEIRLYQWGLIPFWIKDKLKADEIRTKTLNAKAETLTEKPSFRHALKQKRCLVLTNGFYEWQTNGNKKIPYFIGLKEQQAFALAGLHDQWTDPSTGELLNTFTIITTRANHMMEVIHNLKKRMPVILSPDYEKHWLDLNNNPQSFGIFEPYPENLMFVEKMIT